jgi:hypothetical protein
MPNVRNAPILDVLRSARLGFVRSFGGSIAAATCLVLTAASPAASEDVRDRYDGELRRWELAAAAEFGVYARTAKGNGSGTLLVGPRAANANRGGNKDGPNTVISPIEGENDIYSLLMGTTLTVMTPSLADVQTQPRLFFDVSILAPSTLESPVARQGDPGRFGLPFANANVVVINEPQVLGTGTEISSQEQDYQLQAAIGPAFTFDFGENRLRIKPSFRYSRSQNVVSAVADRAVRLVTADPIIPGTNQRLRSLDGYRLLALKDSQKEIYHAIGAGLELEYLTRNQLGPFELSLYLRGAATYILGDRKTSFFQANPEYPAESVTFHYKNDPWAYQAATGIRLRFSPGRPN